MENALLARLRHPPTRREAVQIGLAALEQSEAEGKVCEIARSIGLSHRRFIQLFASEVGLTPKRYQRVRRFQRARELARQASTPDWAQIAVDCGYFDQSHLIHDFRGFSGFSPMDIRQRRNEPILPNHVTQE